MIIIGSNFFCDCHMHFHFHKLTRGEESVPVLKSALIAEIRGENQNLSATEGTTVSMVYQEFVQLKMIILLW